MKIVIISVPSNLSLDEIKHACAELAECLELPEIKVNILNESDIQIESAASTVSPIIESIVKRCSHPNQLITIANFWRLISTGEIDKPMLQTLAAHRNATKAYLNRNNLNCLLQLFDDALLRM